MSRILYFTLILIHLLAAYKTRKMNEMLSKVLRNVNVV